MAAWLVAGTYLQIGVNNNVDLINVPSVGNLTGPTGTKSQVDVTAISDNAFQYIAGLPDFGDVSYTIHWDHANATHLKLFNAYKATDTANSTVTHKIVTAGGENVAFDAVVTGFSMSFAGANESAKVDVTVKVTGAVAIT